MKRNVMLLMLLAGLLLVLAGCGCDHNWEDATCEEPKTCTECGETEGEELGHDWDDATCEQPETCDECGETRGDVADHDWEEATCEGPKTCDECGLTEGEALGHTWVDATTEAPKTCTVCGETEGERITTDPRFNSAAAADLVGTWNGVVPLNDITGLDADLYGELSFRVTMEFCKDGTFHIAAPPGAAEELETALVDAMEVLLIATLKDTLGEQTSDSEIDAFVQETYGMSTREFVQSAIAEQDFGSMLDDLDQVGVYYVEGDQLYTGDDWDDDMETNGFALSDGILTIEDLGIEGVLVEWTKA